MKPHKWAKEIKAWADGAEIQSRWNDKMSHVKHDWHDCDGLIDWDLPASDFRIKPQPKEPQYLYVYQAMGGEVMIESKPSAYCGDCIGKIKLEDE